MSHKLLLLTNKNQQYRQLLASKQLPDLTILDENDNTQQSVQHADIWLADPHLAVPYLTPPIQAKKNRTQLKWLQSTYSGVDALMPPQLNHDYTLTNIRGVFGPLMSEYVFGYLLSHYRHHVQYQQQQTQQQWQPKSFSSLQGLNMLILGTGSIAQHIASTARHFGMKVTGLNKRGSVVGPFNQLDSIDNISTHLPAADVVVSVLPNTVQTTHLLNSTTLALLKPTAMLFNIGRGNAIELGALQHELTQCPQRQAILDVFDQEPLAAEHPLWHLPNVIITPHIAAPSSPAQVVDIFSQNYLLWHQSLPLHFVVDPNQGY
ncbi:D-2-hydroxyacid dehydrogenase [Shewanella algicola]|uniref:D-2-hydroxyacid dehydrogenase n=1 Tax=Shewanella algicola TaxID=640633 RepID=UPI0024959FF5|nr:D-2-hydroxyacid dehydrogenase [Shewanella algicola]